MKSSLYKKIRKYVLIGSSIAVSFICIAAIITILIMRYEIRKTGAELGQAAAEDSRAALIEQKEDRMRQATAFAAEVCDGKLEAASRVITVVAENAEAIIGNPGDYLPHPIDFPSPLDRGRSVAQLMIAEGVSLEEVGEQVGLLANLSQLLVSSYDSVEYVRSVYLGTESGISISADRDSHLKTNVIDPRPRPWYVMAVREGGLAWTDPYADAVGRGLVVSGAMPFFDAGGELYGVVGVTLDASAISDVLMSVITSDTARAFFVHESGEIIISPDMYLDDDGMTVHHHYNLADMVPSAILSRIFGMESDVIHFSYNHNEWVIAFSPLEALPWSLVKIVEVDEIIAPAVESELRIREMTNAALSDINYAMHVAIIVFAVVLLLTIGGSVLLSNHLSAGLAKPIVELCEGAEIIGAGNLNHRLSVKTGDEIESLSDAFNRMVDNVKTITSDNERMSTEYSIASDIHKSLLPAPISSSDDIKVCVAHSYHERLGGSFYDYFFIDGNKLCVIIAEVEGSGIPAALCMVVARTLIKNQMMTGMPVEQAMSVINSTIYENHADNMAVSALVGVFEISTGLFSYVNAGQNMPILRRSGEAFDIVKDQVASSLAEIENITYRRKELRLKQDDRLVLHTAESEDISHLAALCEFLNQANLKGLALDDMIERVESGYEGFHKENNNGMSLLMLEYSKGDKAQAEITVAPRSESYGSAVQPFIKRQLSENNMGGAFYAGISVTLEEIFMIISRRSANSDITVRCTVLDNRVEIRLFYGGLQGNPLGSDKKNEMEAIDFVRKRTHDLRYEHIGGQNILVLVYVDDK